MNFVIVLLALLGSVWLLAVVEGWTTTGRLRPAAPLLSGLAHLGRGMRSKRGRECWESTSVDSGRSGSAIDAR